ncbi:MAG TPA: PKD domain-containing protein, partial [Baekduia sp.]
GALPPLVALLLMALMSLSYCAAASALVEPPSTLDGPSADVLELGGVAIASDGTGGAVWIHQDAGVAHVYVARRLHGTWTAAQRVDNGLAFSASEPRIAASDHGRLLVVWKTPIATVHARPQYALYSSELPGGGAAFSAPLIVDANVGTGNPITPSLAATEPSRALVGYRVVTYDFTQGPNGNVQLRHGDVMAEVRLARYGGGRWSKIGAINRNKNASMPSPTAANGPQVGVADDGSAVAAWIERDQTATARAYARRVFGTTFAPILQASPSTQDGRQVTDDASAVALGVTGLGMAQVVTRVDGIPGGPLGGTRVYANQLPPSLDSKAGVFAGATTVDGGVIGGGVGSPSVAVADGGQLGATRVAFTAPGALRVKTLGSATAPPLDGGPAPLDPSEDTVTALGADGGALTAWTTSGGDGLPAVAVRQEYAEGGVQTGVVAGAYAGDVSQLAIGRDGKGGGVVGWLQGGSGRREVVVDAVTAPPAKFIVIAPDGWVRPRSARVKWDAAPSAAQLVTYTVLIDGQPVAQGLRNHWLTPSPALLGNGVRSVQVRSTDTLGQSIVSDPVTLKVDARPPRAKLTHDKKAPRRKRARAYTVALTDAGSGVLGSRSTARFGDGSTIQKGHRTFRHIYKKAGRYVIRVVTRDKAGNATTLRLRVAVK